MQSKGTLPTRSLKYSSGSGYISAHALARIQLAYLPVAQSMFLCPVPFY